MSHANSQPLLLYETTVDISASVQEISGEEPKQFSKGVCDRCQDLDLPTVVERTKSALSQDNCIGANDEDVRALLQRILFDLDHPFIQDCPICHELERASRKGFKFNSPSDHTSTVGRNGNWFKFNRSDGLIAHYSPSKNMGDGWMSIDYFGIATETSFPIGNSARSYTSRKVSLKTPDYSLLSKWLNHCSCYHKECRPCFSAELESIYLIDVNTRSLVRYPSQQSLLVDYLALSYVWGGTPAESFKLGPLRDELPATIEDAIRVTRNLPKQYLWVDYVCIDQKDPQRQKTQIGLMDVIYSASWATLISLDGLTVCEGLPRVGSDSRVVPQGVVDFGKGNSLLSMMPPLEVKLKESEWATRGWTFQEGILSNRRLIFAREQVYFICNHMSCSESFNFVDKDGFEDPRADDMTAYRCSLRNPLILANLTGETQHAFEDIISCCAIRKLTHQSDALNAVTGLLKRLEKESFPDGFVFGMPRRNFRYSLLWTEDLMRKMNSGDEVDCKLRNKHFPSWSWAGWIWVGWVVRPWMLGCNWCRILQPPLCLWMEDGEEIKPDAIQHCPETPVPLMEPPSTVILDINTLTSGSLPLKEITPTLHHHVESPGLLTIRGLVLQLDIMLAIHTTPLMLRDSSGDWRVREEVHERIELSINCSNILGLIKFEYCGQQPDREFLTENVPQRVDFLLVAFSYNTITGAPHSSQKEGEDTWTLEDEARDYERANLCLHLLLLRWKDGIAFRAGIATLEVKNANILNLQATTPRLTKFKFQ
ncbi:uncharacterized protein PAC_00010 [Phialocephala subalpina]|uniref:Heterokaryon incompatibility domain-containing protein n=1 Tax=Phialocephala subalpina TaxID=576137 RepID=A0A1L7WBI2_9HELO|nr:uncharacterized protein PAC_00010 [Phialocephala subalpina]